jgi:glutamine phosphoribosylpyrophosphate amidotransferase
MSKSNIIIPGPGANVPRHLRKAMAKQSAHEVAGAASGALQNTQILKRMLDTHAAIIQGNQEAVACLLLHAFGTDEDRERIKPFLSSLCENARQVVEQVEERNAALKEAMAKAKEKEAEAGDTTDING